MSDTAPAEPTDPAARMPRELTREVATARTDPNRWIYGDRMDVTDAVIVARGGSRGLALYDDLERDPQVGCELGKRRMALLGREWSVQVGAEDDAQAEAARALVELALKGARFNQAVEKLLDALLKGIAVVEVMWARRDGNILPVEMRGRDPRRFAFVLEADGPPALRLLTKSSGANGQPVPARKFVLHRFGARYEDPWGLGLGSRLFWPVFFKRQGIGFWLSGLEKFGQPTALGKYPAGTSETDLQTLLAALTAIASEAGVAVPDGMAVELLEAKRNGSFDGYEALARYMDEDISKAVLGQTLTTSAGASGSRALGQVHNEVRLELTKGDADLLSDTLNASLVRWIVDLNMPGYAASGLPYPMVWWDVAEPEDLVQRAERDTKVRALGFRPTQDYVTDTYGEGWQPDAAPAPAAAPGDAAGASLAALFAEAGARQRRGQAQAVPEIVLAEQLGQQSMPQTDAWLDAIKAAVDRVAERGGALPEVADEMLKLYPSLGTAALAEAVGQALLVAQLTGRAEIADGMG
jgi:phage gp29-like protein